LALSQLESLKNALMADASINGMVDSKIYKFWTLDKSEPDLRMAAHKSLISCELKDWDGQKTATDPVFIVDIRSRYGSDGGAEYCAEIVKAVKELLDYGFSGVAVKELRGEVKFDKPLVAYRCRLEVYGHIRTAYSLSLYPSIASPQPAEADIIFIAVASPADGLEYRFLVQGPGTGNHWRDLTGWTSRNSFSWKTSEQDIGSSTIKVQIRGGKNKVAEDAETTASYSITADSGGSGSGSLPVITGLYPNLASPEEAGTKIDFICMATDADLDPLFYKFILIGPGTASKTKIVQDWSARNAWSWTPTEEDIGISVIEVQVRDGKNAGKGSYDAHNSINYTITSNSKPTISSLSPSLASPQPPGLEIELICTALDAEENALLYRFWHQPPGAAFWKDLTGWQNRNWTVWKPMLADSGANSLKVQVVDSKHAEKGGCDATTTISYTIAP
jgi:hypothetical protein